MNKTVVALPKFGELIAPCFEVTKSFLIVRLINGEVVSRRKVECGGCDGFGCVQTLKENEVSLLICDGIKGFYKNLLQASGVAIISNISGEIELTITRLLRGELSPDTEVLPPPDWDDKIPREDLICWAKEFFTEHGYAVKAGEDYAPFPVDLIAEIDCPLCRKPIRVAVCCGAHSYRPAQEIQQLHLIAAGSYNAGAYVHASTPQIEELCREYQIELIDPGGGERPERRPGQRIPILRGVIAGHEAASKGNSNDDYY
jgi:predicted Fe-Mo cluster-binding NifX family protein